MEKNVTNYWGQSILSKQNCVFYGSEAPGRAAYMWP